MQEFALGEADVSLLFMKNYLNPNIFVNLKTRTGGIKI